MIYDFRIHIGRHRIFTGLDVSIEWIRNAIDEKRK